MRPVGAHVLSTRSNAARIGSRSQASPGFYARRYQSTGIEGSPSNDCVWPLTYRVLMLLPVARLQLVLPVVMRPEFQEKRGTKPSDEQWLKAVRCRSRPHYCRCIPLGWTAAVFQTFGRGDFSLNAFPAVVSPHGERDSQGRASCAVAIIYIDLSAATRPRWNSRTALRLPAHAGSKPRPHATNGSNSRHSA